MRSTTILATYFRQPRQVAFRKLLFQVHLWLGLVLGVYLAMMGLTGAVLVFEDEYEAASHPALFHSGDATGPRVDVDTVIASVHSKYPNNRIWRIYTPTSRRSTFLVSVEETGGFRTVFVHPQTGALVGELPRDGVIESLWRLHANLTAGTSGRAVNCTLGLVALVFLATGLLVWWPGVARWWRALGFDPRADWRVALRQLHGAVGIWSVAFLAMFAATGALYYYGPTFFALLSPLSKRTGLPDAWSDPALADKAPRPTAGELVARAKAAAPSEELWAVFLPMSDKSPVQVVMAPFSDDLGRHAWDWDAIGHRYIYFDQYDGRILLQHELANRTFADVVRAWIVPLHRGNFDGLPVKILWAILGLVPSLLLTAGVIMWWQRSRRAPADAR